MISSFNFASTTGWYMRPWQHCEMLVKAIIKIKLDNISTHIFINLFFILTSVKNLQAPSQQQLLLHSYSCHVLFFVILSSYPLVCFVRICNYLRQVAVLPRFQILWFILELPPADSFDTSISNFHKWLFSTFVIGSMLSLLPLCLSNSNVQVNSRCYRCGETSYSPFESSEIGIIILIINSLSWATIDKCPL